MNPTPPAARPWVVPLHAVPIGHTPAKRATRGQIKACQRCRQARAACTANKPCDRCVRLGIQDSCIEHTPLPGGRKKKIIEVASPDTSTQSGSPPPPLPSSDCSTPSSGSEDEPTITWPLPAPAAWDPVAATQSKYSAPSLSYSVPLLQPSVGQEVATTAWTVNSQIDISTTLLESQLGNTQTWTDASRSQSHSPSPNPYSNFQSSYSAVTSSYSNVPNSYANIPNTVPPYPNSVSNFPNPSLTEPVSYQSVQNGVPTFTNTYSNTPNSNAAFGIQNAPLSVASEKSSNHGTVPFLIDSTQLTPLCTELVSARDFDLRASRQLTSLNTNTEVAPASTMRILNDFFCNGIEDLSISAFRGGVDNPPPQLVAGMAWILNVMSFVLQDYRHMLETEMSDGTALIRSPPPSHSATSPSDILSSASRKNNTIIFGWNSDTDPNDAQQYSLRTPGSPSKSLPMAPESLYLSFLTCLSAPLSLRELFDPEGTSLRSASDPTFNFSMPSNALPVERRTCWVLSSWQSIPGVTASLRALKRLEWTSSLEFHLDAERFRQNFLPFGVVLYPLFPAPFRPLTPWPNARLARMLGYDHGTLVNKFKIRRTMYSLFDAPSVLAFHTLSFSTIARGQQSITIPISLIRKDGRVIDTLMSVAIRYSNCLPLYGVLYFQQTPSPGTARAIGTQLPPERTKRDQQ